MKGIKYQQVWGLKKSLPNSFHALLYQEQLTLYLLGKTCPLTKGSSKSNNYSHKAGNIQVGGMDGKKKGYRKRKEPELSKENRSLYLKTGREKAFHKGKCRK